MPDETGDTSSTTGGFRCWICLDDEEDSTGMIAPCECVGTNQFVHQHCLETYCLQSLARRPSASLSVACPICLAEYRIVERPGAQSVGWREMLKVASTDQQLLLRHSQFLLLLCPLVVSVCLTWAWLVAHLQDVHAHGDGPPLLAMSKPPFLSHEHASALHSAVSMLPDCLVSALHALLQGAHELLLQPSWQAAWRSLDGEAAPDLAADAASSSGGGDGSSLPPLRGRAEGGSAALSPSGVGTYVGSLLHPAGISRKWSLLYVWLQCAQWYKVLCWLLIIVLGGSDGLLPSGARQLFRIEELLLASEARAQLFVFGQAGPFVLCKLRHFFVTWADPYRAVQLLFYSLFTSHVEVFLTVTVDTIVAAALLQDWLSSLATDIRLRRSLNRIRCGALAVAPSRRSAAAPHTPAPVAASRPHAE